MKSQGLTNHITKFTSILCLALSPVFLACEKSIDTISPSFEEVTTQTTASSNSGARVAGVTYTTQPTTNSNIYTACGNVGYSNGYVSGNIRAKVLSANGDQFRIRIERCTNQQLFGGVGMAYIGVNSFVITSQNQAGKSEIKAGYWYIDVDIQATFSTGSVDFYPVVILPGQNVKWYGQPIKITAQSTTVEKSLVTGTNYRHFCQLNASFAPGMACLPTSYMMSRGIVYSARAVDNTELTKIAKGMGTTTQGGTSIVNASSYAKSDIGSCNLAYSQTTSSSRDQAKENIKSAIMASRPIIALVYPNIATSGTGHFVSIVGIKFTSDEATGLIYYIDPLSRSAGVKSVSVAQFMNSMKSASAYGVYNLLRVGC